MKNEDKMKISNWAKKKYYEENKDRLNEKHNCGCGGCYTTKNKPAHERGKAHIYWSKTGIIPSTLPIDYNWYPHLFKLMKEDKAWVFINWFFEKWIRDRLGDRPSDGLSNLNF